MPGDTTLRLGNYYLLVELASGGMATVYIAKHAGAAGFERLVVIKRVHRHLLKIREFYDMFCDEARVASLIRHPNVVSVDDVVESADELFLVQPYVESVSLARLIEAARKKCELLPPAIVVRIMADALAGLAAAHDAVDMRGNKLEVVHRDVSPQNILVGSDGRSRIIDFGIAKAARRITTTSGGIMKGKLAYMSPEQARQQPVDARADLFAVGSVLHEALTGVQLFRGDDQADVILNVLIAEIAKPSAASPDVPPELDEVARKALEREPEDRFQTAADFLESIEKALAPAQGRDVAQLVERLCGAELEMRRTAVREILDEPPASIIPRLSPLPSSKEEPTLADRAGTSSRPPASKSDVTMAATPALKLRSVPPEGSPLRRTAIAAAIIAGAMLSGFGLVSMFRGPPAAPADPSAGIPANLVALTLTADAPIESVTAEGLRSVELHGNVARVGVAPWSGSLTVRASLKGGAAVGATVDAEGSRDVRLAEMTPASAPNTATAAASAPATASAAATAAATASASASASASAPATATATASVTAPAPSPSPSSGGAGPGVSPAPARTAPKPATPPAGKPSNTPPELKPNPFL
jgi:serine/threonine protein kinase